MFISEVSKISLKIRGITVIQEDLINFINDANDVLKKNHYNNEFDYDGAQAVHILSSNINRSLYEKAISRNPEINDLLPDSYNHSLSLNSNYVSNHSDAIYLGKELEMLKYDARYRLKKCLNPIEIVKIILNFPATFISFIGFQPNEMWKRTINLISWILGFFYKTFDTELSSFVVTFLKNLF